jgi:hypothetical protein
MMTLWGEEQPQETKQCRDCGEVKPLNCFEPNRKFHSKDDPNGRILRRPSCRDCRSQKKKIDSYQKTLYKRPRELECPICLDVVDGSYLRLDHSHETGDVRGWLCDNCNTAIGKLKEDVDVIQRAIGWLKK